MLWRAKPPQSSVYGSQGRTTTPLENRVASTGQDGSPNESPGICWFCRFTPGPLFTTAEYRPWL